MKNALFAVLLAGAVGVAAAKGVSAPGTVDVGIDFSRSFSGASSQNVSGFSIGKSFGQFGLEAGFSRDYKSKDTQNSYSLTGSYPVAQFGKVAVSASAGAAYLDNKRAVDGYALVAGVGASLPLTKRVSFGIDFDRQYGQARVKSSNGNSATASLKYSF